MDHLYLMEAATYKVGIAGDVASRLSALQTANPAMRLVAHMQTPDAAALESRILRHFRDYTAGREHLHRAPPVIAWAERFRAAPNTSTTLGGESWAHDGCMPWNGDDLIREDINGEMELPFGVHFPAAPLISRAGSPDLPNTSSLSVDWYTPRRFTDSARQVMGSIDLDPMSSAEANRSVRASRIFTHDTDGLKHPWSGTVYLNPPWSAADPPVQKLLHHYRRGDVTAAIICLSGLMTSAVWFRPLHDYPMCFPTPRPRFVRPGQSDVDSSPAAGCIFIYLGPDVTRFAAEFHQYGPIHVPYTQG
jgi:ParB family chromosome partitioning protein